MFQDLRYGLRMLLKHKGFTAVAVLTLALGIGANTAIFSLIDAVLLKSLPVKHPDQLVFLERTGAPQGGKRSSNINFAHFEQLRNRQDVLSGICTFTNSSRLGVSIDGQAEVAEGQQVSGDYYAVLGVGTVAGRTFTADDDKVPGGHPVAVISYRYWQRRFDLNPAVVGKTIVLNNTPFTIIGVTPPEFFGATVGSAPDIWVPIAMRAQVLPERLVRNYRTQQLPFVLARLKPGVTVGQASAALTFLTQQLSRDEAGSKLSAEQLQSISQQRIVLAPANQGVVTLRGQFSKPLRTLMAVVGLVLLITCANVANLLLARAGARKKEIAVRLALGASRLRLIRQLLTESILLALAGGALGLLFAQWGSELMLALVNSGSNPNNVGSGLYLDLAVNTRLLAFNTAVAVLAGIFFGLVPSLQATHINLSSALKNSTPSFNEGRSRFGLNKALVVAQVALSLVLLIGAGLFIRSLDSLKNQDIGFNRENVLLLSTDPQMVGYQGKQIADLYQRILERVNALPGVRSASLSRQGLASNSGTSGSVFVQGHTSRPDENTQTKTRTGLEFYGTLFSQVGPRFFETTGMTLLRGRDFTLRDNENAPQVAVVNESFARFYFGDDDPIGKRFGSSPEKSGEIEIIGVVKDAKYHNLREEILPAFYRPFLQDKGSWRETTFQVRTVGDPAHLAAVLRREIRALDERLPLFGIKTLATQVDESLARERLISTL